MNYEIYDLLYEIIEPIADEAINEALPSIEHDAADREDANKMYAKIRDYIIHSTINGIEGHLDEALDNYDIKDDVSSYIAQTHEDIYGIVIRNRKNNRKIASFEEWGTISGIASGLDSSLMNYKETKNRDWSGIKAEILYENEIVAYMPCLDEPYYEMVGRVLGRFHR